MNTEPAKMDIINESPKNTTNKIDSKTLEHVFGTPNNKTDRKMLDSERNHTNNTAGKKVQSLPLLEPDRDKQKPPLTGPEIDDLDVDVAKNDPFPGIDDGLLDTDEHKTELGDDHSDGESKHEMPGEEPHTPGGHNEDGKWNWPERDETDYPYGLDHNGLSPRFGEDGRPISPIPSVSGLAAIDVNTYQQKKNLAQGMMDLALLSANANQLRYVLESSTNHPYYYSSITFISLSIMFQIAVGVGLIMNSRYDVNDKKEICKADRINNFTVLGIFLITIVNVFITSFSVATPTSPVLAQQAGT